MAARRTTRGGGHRGCPQDDSKGRLWTQHDGEKQRRHGQKEEGGGEEDSEGMYVEGIVMVIRMVSSP